MSNRMSVLSRRLERFAVVFSVATFSFFAVGLYASANAKGQLVFLCAGLFSACFFVTFFLWLAHGFAWAMIPEKPAAEKKPVEAMRSTEEMRPVERKPAEEMRPVEKKPAVEMRPAEQIKPAEEKMPAEAMRPVEALKPAEAIKPVEEKVITPEDDPPDAKYTITGKRIY
jgi:hypothetical protein